MKAIEQLLLSEPRGILSLTGGVGKMSLIFHLARSGKRVLTTTKIFVPTAEQSPAVLVADDPQSILQQAGSALLTSGQVTAAA